MSVRTGAVWVSVRTGAVWVSVRTGAVWVSVRTGAVWVSVRISVAQARRRQVSAVRSLIAADSEKTNISAALTARESEVLCLG